MIRFALLAMNAAAIAFLIYWLLKVNNLGMAATRKRLIILGGIILLLLPSTMIIGFLRPTPAYLVMYPIAIALFIYMFKLPD